MSVEQERFQIVASIVLFNHSYEQVEDTLTSLLNEQMRWQNCFNQQWRV